ncbi:hypothetical protein HNQ96_004683 [Aminobacter lissarensis]|uniref:Conjugal transfer protein TraC n=1 Tax=Aminobacter carboxidus TaxID=376165 RepID=A0A8E1WH40_9HYPH|nr:conjugal transfer protein TraC [Aminobacter lissarensis]MBB6468796.1 hypothetical protein [Aminobacter lissarensis]
MKKPPSKIKAEIARLHEQLKQAETREAERIGRLALKAGLGEIEIDEAVLLAAFEELSARFHDSHERPSGKPKDGSTKMDTAAVAAGHAARRSGEV